ncbi:MAG TPA: magnesium chelatase domain-containing protein, partial [Candidatus Polarisedimenticolaceae bacterium]|nr:magnesium chelatase domain-containing protein [Candidatus Polarisedimenticolaceae bacterium]
MLGRTVGAVLIGAEARLVDVEVHLGGGLPNIAAVGLPNSSVREGIDRIRAALAHSGFKLPPHRVTVNLAPGDVRKDGAALDLPIAAAILAADGALGLAPARDLVLAGELALDGAVRPVRG